MLTSYTSNQPEKQPNAQEEIAHDDIRLRTTALWAFSEAFLGGMLHAFKVPFSGLFLSLIASICITMLAAHQTRRGQILQATLSVMAVKFMLSPHTPVLAYFAVWLQGLVGTLLFWRGGYRLGAAFVLPLFAVTYSAFQHLVSLTLVWGKSFWVALDIFLNKVTATFVRDPQQYSLYLVGLYLLLHLIGGALGGWLNVRLLKRLRLGQLPESLRMAYAETPYADANKIEQGSKRRKRTVRWWMVVLAALLLASYLPVFENTVLRSRVWETLLRGVLLLSVWFWVVMPLLSQWVARRLDGYQHEHAAHLQRIVAMLPSMRRLVQAAWRAAQRERGLRRYGTFLQNVFLLNALAPLEAHQPGFSNTALYKAS